MRNIICDYFANNSPKSVSRDLRDFHISLETLHLDSIAGETEAEFLKFYGQSRTIQSLNRELIPSAGFTLTIIILT